MYNYCPLLGFARPYDPLRPELTFSCSGNFHPSRYWTRVGTTRFFKCFVPMFTMGTKCFACCFWITDGLLLFCHEQLAFLAERLERYRPASRRFRCPWSMVAQKAQHPALLIPRECTLHFTASKGLLRVTGPLERIQCINASVYTFIMAYTSFTVNAG